MEKLKQLVESRPTEIAVIDAMHNVSLSYREFYSKVEQLAFQFRPVIR